MVGVPHSTGCARCRERRIKCDEATPNCTQCRKYGRPCPGYRRTFRFQDEGPGLERRHQSSSTSTRMTSSPSTPTSTTYSYTPTSTSTSTSTSMSTPRSASTPHNAAAAVVRTKALALFQHQLEEAGCSSSSRSSSGHNNPYMQSSSSSSASSTYPYPYPLPVPSPSPTSWAQQPSLFAEFLRETFPRLLSLQNPPQSHSHSHAHRQSHSQSISSRTEAETDCASTFSTKLLQNTQSPLPSAIFALTTIYHAHHPQTHPQTRTHALKSARHVYASALQQVATALDDPHLADSSSTLATIMVLALYETYAQTSYDAWMIHADGVRRLMVSRGVGAHSRGLGGLCYRGVRGVLVALAVEEGGGCFLEGGEWDSLAFSSASASSGSQSSRGGGGGGSGRGNGEWGGFVSAMERTFVEVVKCPGLLAEGRQYALDGRRGSAVRELRGRVMSLRARLVRLVGDLRSAVRACQLTGEGAALVVQGAETAAAVLEALLERMGEGDIVRPFRVVSALASLRLCGGDSLRGAAALDRVASSMGMIGTVLVRERAVYR